MNAQSLIDYFKPLSDWLVAANNMSRECIGWEGYCESDAAAYMSGEYETTTSQLYNQATIAEWNYNVNITEANQEEAVRTLIESISAVQISYQKSLDNIHGRPNGVSKWAGTPKKLGSRSSRNTNMKSSLTHCSNDSLNCYRPLECLLSTKRI